MKKEKIKFYPNAKVICSSCNAELIVGSSQPEIKVEICSKDHPFYLGKAGNTEIVAGQVEKFYKRYNLKSKKEREEESKE